MIDLLHINLTTLMYVTEEIDKVKQCLYNCVPEEFRKERMNIQHLQSQFRDKMKILTLELDKPELMKEIIAYLAGELDQSSKAYFKRYLKDKVDLDTKTVHLRLDKFKAFDGILKITEGSDVIKVKIKYTAFAPGDNTLENVTGKLVGLGLIE